jgi:uncharacterized membrane protein (UPF0127 family)
MNLEQAAARIDSERGLHWLWAGVWILFALAMGACIAKGADRPADPTLQDSSRVAPFAEVAFSIDPADGDARDYCALLADSDELRGQGLMGRNDLAGYDAMVFTWDSDVETGFYMLNTPLPLSIAWFDSQGVFVSAADMEPCIGQTECPDYFATRAYRTAVEVPKGGLGSLGAGAGSRISVGGSCGG